jgi:hypothetical protein
VKFDGYAVVGELDGPGAAMITCCARDDGRRPRCW